MKILKDIACNLNWIDSNTLNGIWVELNWIGIEFNSIQQLVKIQLTWIQIQLKKLGCKLVKILKNCSC
jgi:hypothetical protein